MMRLVLLFAILAIAGTANGGLPGDDCASAILVTAGLPAAEGDNSEASASDDGEAGCQVSDFDVWFEFVATFACTGSVTVDTFGSGQEDTVLSVFDACGGVEIVCNDDAGGDTLSQVTFDATGGQSYLIRLASFAAPGDFDLNISCSNPPANDDCASATVVTGGTPAAEGDNTSASATDDAEASCQVSDFDVWFQYAATCTGDVTVDTSGSGQEDTVLTAYDVCGGTEIACNDDVQGSPLAQFTFAVTEGQAYQIRLASFAAPGDYDLNITCAASCLDAAECDDGLFCNGEEDCAEGICLPGLAPCGEELCSEELDACVDCLDDCHCNDSDACTLDVCDPDTGGCTHDSAVCDDEDACTADSCEPATGCIYSPIDTDEDGTPDCEDPCPIDNPDDTDGDGVCDSDDICAGGDDNLDEDKDGVPDFCDPCPQDNPDDSDGDGVCDSSDNCELFNPDQLDCQPNGVGDVCDLDDGTSQDCNENAIPDECDISEGTSDDCDANGTPDECEICVGDLDCDDTVGAADLAILLGSWGPCPDPDDCPADMQGKGDGIVGAGDLAVLLGNWGPCD